QRTGSFVDRYTGVNQQTFVAVIIGLYIAEIILGGIIYPNYRINVRIPFEEMNLAIAVGLFECKEDFGGIGLGILAAYFWLLKSDVAATHGRDRTAVTAILTFIVWYDFLIGHILNNIRGLS